MRSLCGVLLVAVSSDYVEFPSSCIGEANGYQWIKPLEGDSFPPINQKCDSEYMVIDVDRDENVKAYFSSFESWHYALSGFGVHSVPRILAHSEDVHSLRIVI